MPSPHARTSTPDFGTTRLAASTGAFLARPEPLVSVGIDAEPHAALPGGACRVAAVAEEQATLARLAMTHPTMHWDRPLFSAKESISKAWYPFTRRELDFVEARLDIDRRAGAFVGHLTVDGARLTDEEKRSAVDVRYLIDRDVQLTTVVVSA
ncbi:4'-phosphopantetheinyl transferase superfamily protein [Micromonospora sp. LOL_023]|uniref:4'-phosphopantetheinyl transferase superfamily protein n=1 Tax=Micromonospora sp. LOL_023 TaxID=3345418 RepID=UPI003A8823DC